MKIKALKVAAGVSAPLILAGSVHAGFTGITTTSKPNAFGLLVVNVYANFDRPGTDAMVAVGKTPDSPLFIQVVGGTFYNHAFGGDQAPHHHLLELFPSLAYDTFVTIGMKVAGPTEDASVFTGTFGVSTLQDAGWAVTPNSPQGNPFNAVNSFPGDGRILIGQFATADGTSIQGTMLLQFTSNGVAGVQAVVGFNSIPAPGALAMMGSAGLAGLFGTRRRRRQPRGNSSRRQ
ncbi:MAG: PEP-CTERM sorting domain-containing protein [Planctomycetes bacterium]|nr:PEP-CTERM sorting domain-containing protein [Planctomycetota bacterium]